MNSRITHLRSSLLLNFRRNQRKGRGVRHPHGKRNPPNNAKQRPDRCRAVPATIDGEATK